MTTNTSSTEAGVTQNLTAPTPKTPSQRLKATGMLAGIRPIASRAEEKAAYQKVLEKRYR